MNLRPFVFLPLIFLAAAAAPQGDCASPGGLGGGSQAMAAPLDPAGRPVPSPGLGAQVFAALPTPEVNAGCQTPLPTPGQPGSLRSNSMDVLHGLPVPDIARPINEPKRPPFYQ